jgi:hypothetical protein
MRTKRSIKDSLKEYLNWCVGRLLLGGSRDDTVRDMVDAISDEIASGGGGVSQDQLDQTVQDITKSYGIADQTVLTSAESYTDQKIADVVDGSPEALDTLYELAKALGDDSNFATTVMDQIGQKLPTTTFENFIDNKAWTKDNLTKLSQLINNINSIKAGTRVESMDVNLASISSYLEYDLFDNNTTGTKPPGLTTGFLLTFSWDNGGWGAQIATSDGNVDGAIFLRTIKASESDKIWGPWVSLYNTANFNPDSKLNYNGFKGDLDTISTSGMYRLLSGCTNIPLGSSQGCFLLHTNWDANAAQQMYFVYSTTNIYIRNKVGGTWNPWQKVWNAGNFNPDSKFPYLGMGGVNDNSNEIGAGYSGSSAGGNFNGPFIKFGQTSNYMAELYNRHDQDVFQIRRMVNGEWQAFVNLWHSGNFNPDNYLPLTGNKTITGSLTVANGFTSGIMKCQTGAYPQLQFEQTNTGVTSILFVHTNNALTYRPVDPGSDYTVYHSGNFNPDNYLLKTANAVSASKWATARTLTLTGSASGNVSMDGSANVSLSVTNNRLNSNSEMTYGWNGINYFNLAGTAGAAAKINDTPTTAWWHILRFNHGNSAGYYTDLAVPFNDNTLYYKRVTSGTLQNGGWVKIWDEKNANLSTVDWAAKNITAAGTVTATKLVIGGITIDVYNGALRVNGNLVATGGVTAYQ